MTEDGRPVGCRGREEPHRVYFPQADSEEAKLADDVDDLLLEERLRLACGRSRLLGLGRSLEWRESLADAHHAVDGLFEEEPDAHDAKDLDASARHVHHEGLHGHSLGRSECKLPRFGLAKFIEVDLW